MRLALRTVGAAAALWLLLCAGARADVTVAGSVSASGLGTTLAIPGVEVDDGHGRLLAVGISTTEAVSVTSVTYGSQALSPAAQQAGHGTRAELWALTRPAVGTADLTVALSGSAAGVIGAVSYTGVDPLDPVIGSNGESQDLAVNTAGMSLVSTTQKDGIIGVIALGNTDFTPLGSLTTGMSLDLVTADVRWKHTGGVHGALATRVGNTGQNMAQWTGINWRWTPNGPLESTPFSHLLLGLRAQAEGDPVADAGGPYSIAEGDPLSLDGSGSTSPDSDPLSYAWDVNGDSTYGDATGAAPTLTWSQLDGLGLGDGPVGRNVTVEVEDVELVDTSDTAPLTIANTAPDATLENSGPVVAGEDATIAYSDASDPSAADTSAGFRYAFDLDDDGSYEVGGGTYATAVTAPSTVLTTEEAGEHVVRAAIIDKDGGIRIHTTTVVVEPAPVDPEPPAGPAPVETPSAPLTIAPPPVASLTAASINSRCARRSKLAARGATAIYEVDHAGPLQIELQRRIEAPAPRKCPPPGHRRPKTTEPLFYVPVFSSRTVAAPGLNRVPLPRNLRPGTYWLLLTTLDANGAALSTTRVRLTVLPDPR